MIAVWRTGLAMLLLPAALPVVAQQAQQAQVAQPAQPTYTIDSLPPPGPLQPDPNAYPNPYRLEAGILKMPPGRAMGSTSAVAIDSKGNIWVAERCGANSCADSAIDPIMEFDAKGNFIKAFGGGMMLFPHGFYIDAADNVWVTDSRIAGGRGGQVLKFSSKGALLMTLGSKGLAGDGRDRFSEPNAVIVAKDGSIFVADGHTPDKGNARIVKFDALGRFVKAFGGHGRGPGQLEVPHALAIDSKGRLFVADRWNNRVSIFDQDGGFITSWTQFGRPSGLFIDARDTLYSTDSESRTPVGYGYNPGWRRGIRIGSARTGKVTAFIPDAEPEPDKGATSGGEGLWVDRQGMIYIGTVKERAVMRFVRAGRQ